MYFFVFARPSGGRGRGSAVGRCAPAGSAHDRAQRRLGGAGLPGRWWGRGGRLPTIGGGTAIRSLDWKGRCLALLLSYFIGHSAPPTSKHEAFDSSCLPEACRVWVVDGLLSTCRSLEEMAEEVLRCWCLGRDLCTLNATGRRDWQQMQQLLSCLVQDENRCAKEAWLTLARTSSMGTPQ